MKIKGCLKSQLVKLQSNPHINNCRLAVLLRHAQVPLVVRQAPLQSAWPVGCLPASFSIQITSFSCLSLLTTFCQPFSQPTLSNFLIPILPTSRLACLPAGTLADRQGRLHRCCICHVLCILWLTCLLIFGCCLSYDCVFCLQGRLHGCGRSQASTWFAWSGNATPNLPTKIIPARIA